MRLTKEEFSIFNLTSKIKMVENDGIYLIKKVIDDKHEIRLFLLYGFYVEVYCNYKLNKMLEVKPVVSKKWLNTFYMGLINQSNFC